MGDVVAGQKEEDVASVVAANNSDESRERMVCRRGAKTRAKFPGDVGKKWIKAGGTSAI